MEIDNNAVIIAGNHRKYAVITCNNHRYKNTPSPKITLNLSPIPNIPLPLFDKIVKH